MKTGHLHIWVLLLVLMAPASVSYANDVNWIVGKWELIHDPDGAATDWLEFTPDGDVYSIGANGKIPGIYIVTPDSVKAVFTYQEQDIITTFHFDENRELLKIVTSHTGKESIYRKVSTREK